MKICSITRSTPLHPGAGGMETIHWDILKGLVTRGHEVMCITTDSLDEKPSAREGIQLVYLPGTSSGYTDAWLTAAAEEAEAQGPDAVLSNSAGAHFLVRREPAFPVVMQAHSTLLNELRNRIFSRNPRRIAGLVKQVKPIAREIRSLPKYTSVVATAQNAFDTLGSYPSFVRPQRIDYIPNGVALPQTARPEPQVNPGLTVLFIGRVIPDKGVDLLIEAMSHLPNASLRIAGDAPSLAPYEEQVRSLGLTGQVEFLGQVDRETGIPRLLSEADVLVAPSRGPEGLMLAILEAMAHGLPVVASPSASAALAESAPAGLLTCDLDPERIAASIRESQTIPSDACILPAEFRVDSMVNHYEKLLTELRNRS